MNIGERAFYWCKSLEEFTIKAKVTTLNIKKDAFYLCEKLVSFTVESNVQKPGVNESAFKKCSGLETIKIPNCDINKFQIGDDKFVTNSWKRDTNIE